MKGKASHLGSLSHSKIRLKTSILRVVGKGRGDVLHSSGTCSLTRMGTHGWRFPAPARGPPGHHPPTDLVGGSLQQQQKKCTARQPWGGSVRGCEEEPILGFSLWSDKLRESLRKQVEFALDWTLSGSGTILWLGILINLICREGRLV